MLITAGDSAVGRDVIMAFVREGADVAISYATDEPEMAEVTGALARAGGGRVALVPGDVADRGVCERVVDMTVEQLGGLDVLVVVERVERAPVASWTSLIRAAVKRLDSGAAILVGSSSIDRDLAEQLTSSGIRLARVTPRAGARTTVAAAYVDLATEAG